MQISTIMWIISWLIALVGGHAMGWRTGYEAAMNKVSELIDKAFDRFEKIVKEDDDNGEK